jgi:cell wall-associated NlpC family hydrolase
MVSYVYEKSADMRLAGSAADLARQGKPVAATHLRPGDLVFFNTRNRPRSHVGIYIGDDRFVHAPNSRGKVRTESLKSGWFAARFEEGRTYFD